MRGLKIQAGDESRLYPSGSSIANSIPPAAATFIAAAGITDPTQQAAIVQLVTDLTAYGLWDKIYAAYPFVGGTTSQHKYNLIDPQDTDAAYRIVFNGSFTQNTNGITSGGADTDYADTRLNGSTVLNKVDMSYSFYSRTDSEGLSTDFGSVGASPPQVFTRFGGDIYQDIPSSTQRVQTTNATTLGLFSGSCNATNVVAYKNGTPIGTFGSAAVTDFPNANIWFCNSEGGGVRRPSTRNLAWGHIGMALTAGEMADLYTTVQAFQTTLGRNV